MEVDSLALERRVEIVCEFMLAHPRDLRQANIDFEKLLSLVRVARSTNRLSISRC
jgi:hypothetical protein